MDADRRSFFGSLLGAFAVPHGAITKADVLKHLGREPPKPTIAYGALMFQVDRLHSVGWNQNAYDRRMTVTFEFDGEPVFVPSVDISS